MPSCRALAKYRIQRPVQHLRKNAVVVVDATRNAWEEIGENLPSPHLTCPAFIRAFNKFVERLPTEGRVLDLGCGLGAVARLLVARGLNVVGIDYAGAMIAGARARVPEATFILQSMLEIAFEEEFDGVLASYSLLGLTPPEFEIMAGKITRSLRPGGAVLVALNEPDSDEDQDATSISTIGGHHMYSRTYTEAEVRLAFSDLEIVSVERGDVTSSFYGKEKCLCIILAKE